MLGLLRRRSSESADAKSGAHESVDTLSCRFEGTTAEYFEIWIVNLLLTICSLGVFSPWAAARRRQYFYSKTSLGKYQLGYQSALKSGAAFWAAVRTAAIVGVLVALLVQPLAALGLVVLTALLYPAYRHQTLFERAAATHYRGRAFSYSGSVKDSYIRLVAWPIFTVVFAFLPLGHSLRSSWGYRFEHHNYGEERFSAKLKLSKLWALVALTAVVAVLAYSLVGAATFAALVSQGGERAAMAFLDSSLAADFGLTHVLVLGALLLVSVWPVAVWKAGSEHALADGVQLEAGICFDTEISATRLSVMYFTNALFIVASLGMAIPWATIRVARYRASVTTLLCYTDIEDLVGDRGMDVLMLNQTAQNKTPDSGLSLALDDGELDLPKAA